MAVDNLSRMLYNKDVRMYFAQNERLPCVKLQSPITDKSKRGYAYENQKAKLVLKYKDIVIERESENLLQKAQNQPRPPGILLQSTF